MLYVEFGGLYINQFHYHRDRGRVGIPVKGDFPRWDTGGERERARVRSVRFRSRNFSLGDKTSRGGREGRNRGNDIQSRSHPKSLPGASKKSPANFPTSCWNYLQREYLRRIFDFPRDYNGRNRRTQLIPRLILMAPTRRAVYRGYQTCRAKYLRADLTWGKGGGGISRVSTPPTPAAS